MQQNLTSETLNVNCLRYILQQNIVNFLIRNDCVIFGGYVRDKIIHDHFAKKFYCSNDTVENYHDPKYDSETKLRLLVPKDIDVYKCGTSTDIDNLLTKLEQELGVVVYKHDTSTTSDYQIFEGISRKKCRVSLTKMYMLRKLDISMDFVYSETPKEPPFGKLDFLCNGFILDKTGMSFTNNSGVEEANFPFIHFYDKKVYESEIISDILRMKTKPAGKEVDEYRTTKMIKKGWKITDSK